MKKKISGILLSFVLVLVYSFPASASVKQIKIYKEAYPDEKPKCAHCHVSEKPMKDDHDLNDYGKKVVGLAAEPTADTYKQAGQ